MRGLRLRALEQAAARTVTPMKRFPDEGIETIVRWGASFQPHCTPMKRFPDEGIETVAEGRSFA